MLKSTLFGRRVRRVMAVICSVPAWLFMPLIVHCVPRKKGWIAVIGSHGHFGDNAKYFYLNANKLLSTHNRCVFITTDAGVRESLHREDFPAMCYPSIEAIWFLMRAGSVVVDASDWAFGMRRFLVFGSHIVQLWHGVGFKRINRSITQEMFTAFGPFASLFRLLRNWMAILAARDVCYDIFIAPSEFYRDEVFAPAFRSKEFLLAAYPRNTFGQGFGTDTDAAVWSSVDVNVSSRLAEWVHEERRIVIVAPTFRDTRSTPLGLDRDTLGMIDHWCSRNHTELIFKFHPNEMNVRHIQGRHLHCCNVKSDLYPLIPFASAMVTDYSSICMDFLIIDKPIIFFTPDIEAYVKSDRGLQFDYDLSTPGPKVQTWSGVLTSLSDQMKRDDWAEQRRVLRDRAFGQHLAHDATGKILEYMKDRDWIA